MTDAPQNTPRGESIVLIGYRGCGKTSVGAALATRLNWPFVDTDARIEQLAGKPIRDIFTHDGEPAFRALESNAIAELAHGPRQVVSVGGGAVLREENRVALQRSGVCVWLTAPAEVLHERIVRDPRSAGQRPALTDRTGLDEVRHLLAQRAPLYAALADHVLDTGGRTPAQLVDELLALVRRRAATDSH